MRRTFRILLILAGVLMALVPGVALAQDGTGEDDLLLRVNGPIVVAADQTMENVVVISDNATVEGVVEGSLVVIDGDAVIAGQVNDDVTVVSGTLTLQPTAQVRNISVLRGELVRQDGATVTGTISRSELSFDFWGWSIFSGIVWLGIGLVMVVSGLIFTAVAGGQLKRAGDLMVEQIGPTLLAAVVIWIAMPILMIAVLFTLVGIPLGIGYFLFVLPVLAFLGYVVAGALLGRTVLRSLGGVEHPYLAALAGLALLQVIGLIPWIGWIASFVATTLGSGALLLLGWRAWRGNRTQPTVTVTATPHPAPAA